MKNHELLKIVHVLLFGNIKNIFKKKDSVQNSSCLKKKEYVFHHLSSVQVFVDTSDFPSVKNSTIKFSSNLLRIPFLYLPKTFSETRQPISEKKIYHIQIEGRHNDF